MSMELYSSKQVKASSEHFCSYCGRKTEVGESIFRERGKFDGEFFTRYACPDCQKHMGAFWDYCDYECFNLIEDFSEWACETGIDHPMVGRCSLKRPITAQMVKEFRETTGAGIHESKEFLTLAEGNWDIALELHRVDGFAFILKDGNGNIVKNRREFIAKQLLAQKETKISKCEEHSVEAVHDSPPTNGLAYTYGGISGTFDRQWWLELVSDEDGNLDEEKVLAELHDFCNLIHSVSRVYDSITNGRISKPHTAPWVVISEVDDIMADLIREAVEEALEDQ